MTPDDLQRIGAVEALLRTRFKLGFNKTGNCTTFRKDQAEELEGQWVWLIDASDGINSPLYPQSVIDALTAERDRLRDALSFYGNARNWEDSFFKAERPGSLVLSMSSVMSDDGKLARSVLGGGSGG